MRCRDGKANPRRKSDSVALVEVLGLRSLCAFSLYRDLLVAHHHYPALLTPEDSPKPRKLLRNRPERIEVEVIDTPESGCDDEQVL